MFEFSSKAKQFAIALTVVGAILWLVGYALNGPSSGEGDHGNEAHATEMHEAVGHDSHAEESHGEHGEEAHDDYPGEAHAAMIQSSIEDSHAEAHSDRPKGATGV